MAAPDPATLAIAGQRAVNLHVAPPAQTVGRMIMAADVVQVHFWNTPELYAFLDRPWPAARWLVWSHVNGRSTPHVLIPELRDFADLVVLTEIPDALAAGGARSIPAGVDLDRLGADSREPHDGVTVGIFGSLDASKIHPDTAQMLIDAAPEWSRVLIVGAGDGVGPVLDRLSDAGLASRITATGFVENVGAHLRSMDVLLHLVRPDGSATCDLSLQEAMSVGVVPVVLSGTGPARLVRHGLDGLVATTAAEASTHLGTLAADPDLRHRMSAAARSRARQFDAAHARRSFEDVYRDMCRIAPRRRTLSVDGPRTGADAFLRSLGAAALPFRESQLTVVSPEVAASVASADRIIAASSPALVSPGAGGVLHYRRCYARDPWLRYWSGLVLAHAGRHALAAVEFVEAARLGMALDRVEPHLEAVRRAARQ